MHAFDIVGGELALDHEAVGQGDDFRDGPAGRDDGARAGHGERQQPPGDRRPDDGAVEFGLQNRDPGGGRADVALELHDLPVQLDQLRARRQLPADEIADDAVFAFDQRQLAARG